MPSFAIPIPPEAIFAHGIDLDVAENKLHLEHVYSMTPTGEPLVLTSLYYSATDPQINLLYLSHFNRSGDLLRQRLLTDVQVRFTAQKLFPVSLLAVDSNRVLVGAFSLMRSPIDNSLMNVVVMIDLARGGIERTWPHFAARMARSHDDRIFVTLHYNTISCQRHKLDDVIAIGVDRFPELTAQATPKCEPVIVLSALDQEEFPHLTRPLAKTVQILPQLSAEIPTPSWRTWGVGTHSISPLNDGNLLISIWDTARHVVLNYLFCVVTRYGEVTRIFSKGIEHHSQLLNHQPSGSLIYKSASRLAIWDYSGNELDGLDLGTIKSTGFAKYELVATSQSGDLMFALPRKTRQNNTFLIAPGSPIDAIPTAAAEAARHHAKWLRALTRATSSPFARWTI